MRGGEEKGMHKIETTPGSLSICGHYSEGIEMSSKIVYIHQRCTHT